MQALRYNRMVENALRAVMSEALKLVARQGFPENHHFYITFRTDHPGVMLEATLRQRYPEEMTIVIQHQFWNLVVDEDGFSVGLSFDGVRQTLGIPFAAVTNFADPSVKFGLHFEVADEPTVRDDPQPGIFSTVTNLTKRPKRTKSDSQQGADVVTLDSRRKK